MSELKVGGVIWHRSGESSRKIVGETRVSWLVEPGCDWMEPIRVNKKDMNKDGYQPQWFLTKEERDSEVWADRNFYAIQRQIGEYGRRVDAATLRKIADLIGYKETA